MDDQEKLAAQLYESVSHVIHGHGKLGLLKAVGDASARVKWDETHPQTRAIFTMMSEKLTEIQRQG